MKIILIFVLFFNTIFISAQESGADILETIQKKFDTIDNLSVDFSQLVNGKQSVSGKLLYKKENKFRVELSNSIIVTDGTNAWNYNKKDNKVIINNNSDDSDGFAFSINKIIYDYPSQCETRAIQENNNAVLILTPVSSDLKFKLIKLWAAADGLIQKVLIDDPYSGQIQISFSGYKINPGLSDSQFKFIPPEGSKIIDLR